MTKKYLLESQNLSKIKNSIRNHSQIMLFLDYDGTLAPFKADPLAAYVLPEIKKSLLNLKTKQNFILTLVSGRKLSQLRKMIDLNQIHYAGSHGLEIDLSFDKNIDYPQQKKDIDPLSRRKYQKIREKYLEAEEIKLEDKGFGLALHIDSKKEQQTNTEELKKIFQNTVYQVLSGRKVIEIRPEGWNKAKAVNYITAQFKENLGLDDYLRIYIGDDKTDEDVFRNLKDGITIYVQNEGNLNTAAEYYLKNPKDTAKLLAEIVGA